MQPQEGISQTQESSNPRLDRGGRVFSSTQMMTTAKDCTRDGSRSSRRTAPVPMLLDDEDASEKGSEDSEYEDESTSSTVIVTKKAPAHPKESNPKRISKTPKIQRTGADGKVMTFIKGSKHELNFRNTTQRKLLLSRIQELENELTESETQRIKLEEEVLNMQKDALMHMKEKITAAPPNNEVRAEFDRILRMCSKWAKAWSAHLPTTINIGRAEFVRGRLDFSTQSATDKVWDHLLAGTLTMRTVVEHLVSKLICDDVFTRPFWILGYDAARKEQGHVPLNIEESLTWIMKNAGKGKTYPF
jgi:hypothetical protein